MAIELQEHIRIDYIREEMLQVADIRLGILRLDEIHPQVSGNKWFKLKENIGRAKARGADTLLSFGGAFSNHLLATAAAAKANGLSAVGIVRGLHARDNPSVTLRECNQLGMQLVYVSKEEYQQKDDTGYNEVLQKKYPAAFIIPEGGNNEAGLQGVGAIAAYLPEDASLVTLAMGTGTTFAGIRAVLDNKTAMLGFPVMKGGSYLQQEVEKHITISQNNWRLNDQYHFGGFARYTDALLAFMNAFYQQHHIPLDFVYTGKMIYGILDRIRNKEIEAGSHIIAIHTGGLQGNRSVGHLLSYS